MTAAWQPPPVGWHGVVRITDGDSISTPAFRMLDDQSPYNGIPAYRISSGPSVIVCDRGNGNQIAMLTPDGSKQWEMTPDEGTFSWPLFVGKTWTAKYRYHDFRTQKDFDDVEADWKVEALEDVTVPAGTFKAFRLQSSPGANNATNITVWYAPEKHVVVKRVFERTFYHYLGAGTRTIELVSLGDQPSR